LQKKDALKTRTSRSAEEENRKAKKCTFCGKSFKWELLRHLTSVHSGQVKSIREARKIVIEANRQALAAKQFHSRSGMALAMHEVRDIFGEHFLDPSFPLKLNSALRKVGGRLEGTVDDESPAENPEKDLEQYTATRSEKDAAKRPEKDTAASVKSRVKFHLGRKSVKSEAYKLYAKHQEDTSKNKRTAANRASNLARYLGYAEARLPNTKNSFELLVNMDIGREFIDLLVNECQATPATVVNYLKEITICLKEAANSWRSKLPKGASFMSKLGDARVCWAKLKLKCEKRRTAQKNENLSSGSDRVTDLRSLYQYLEDPDNLTELSIAMKLLENHAKICVPVKVTRADVAVTKAWNFVINFLSVTILVTNAGRTGDVQNFTLAEFQSAKLIGRLHCLIVAEHKVSERGCKTLC